MEYQLSRMQAMQLVVSTEEDQWDAANIAMPLFLVSIRKDNYMRRRWNSMLQR